MKEVSIALTGDSFITQRFRATVNLLLCKIF